MIWEDIKREGSGHYKCGEVEPIDLMKSLDILQAFAVGNIIKYASRQATQGLNVGDLTKMKHYIDMLIVLATEK